MHRQQFSRHLIIEIVNVPLRDTTVHYTDPNPRSVSNGPWASNTQSLKFVMNSTKFGID
jgi:hypothetical protein